MQDALANAAANDEIRVAAGVYCPDLGAGFTPGDRNASFVLRNLVKIIGGYPAGGGTVRDWQTNLTILSGDLNADDNPETLVQDLLSDATRADNSYHVVYSNLCGPPTLLDGLVITGGQANGGGWYNITNSSPTITNCTFTRNAAQSRGGAWYNEGANCKPTLTHVTFTQNFSGDCGGAVSMFITGADVKLDDCTLSQNRAANYGGSVYLDRSSPTILNSAFSNDYAANGGSLAGINISAPTITNTTFTSSSATTGGAVWLDNCQAKFYDSTFTTNSATNGGVCFINSAQNQFNDCMFKENIASNKGGAVHANFSSPQLTRITFIKNSAASGGAIYDYSGHPKLISCKFFGNYAHSWGGAIGTQASGSRTSAYHAYLTGWSCIFTGNYVINSGACGGAIANYHYEWVFRSYPKTSIIR